MMRMTMRTRMTAAVVVMMMMWYCDRPASGVTLFVSDC